MKSILSSQKLKRAFGRLSMGAMALTLLLGNTTPATAQNCLTTSLVINTGYNPATNTVLPIGAQDPHWKITALTPSLTPAQPLSYGAFTVLGNPAWPNPWPISTTSNWISFNTFPSYSTIGANNFAMTITRSFKNCKTDKYVVSLKQFTFDQTIQIYVDGVLMYTNTNAGQYTSFISTSFVTAALPAGTHNMDVIVYNNAGHYPDDGHGLNITGNIASATGINSLVSEASGCENYNCGIPSLTAPASGKAAFSTVNAIAQNSPNPFQRDTKIEVFIAELKKEARVSVYDLNGKEVLRYPVSKTGQTDLTVSSDKLAPGVYAYSLFVDGALVDSKRMVVAQ